jgi:hypothetical protein
MAWLLAMIQISWWTHTAPAATSPRADGPRQSKPQQEATSAPNDDLDAFKAYEDVTQAESSRQFFRNGTLETLNQPWSSFCEPAGHKRLLTSVGYYYYDIDNALRVARQYHGPKVAAYVRERNNTSDDIRINELIQQAYRNGYFAVDELPDFHRKLVAAAVKDEKPRGKPCS